MYIHRLFLFPIVGPKYGRKGRRNNNYIMAIEPGWDDDGVVLNKVMQIYYMGSFAN